jgi:hypothetical protein
MYNLIKEIVRLPTKGYFYPKESPLSKGFLYITPFTTWHEDVLTSANLKKEGHHLKTILDDIIQEDIEVDDLTFTDRDGLLLASYILSFGPALRFPHDCANCGEKNQVVINLGALEETVTNFQRFTKGKNEFEVTLPKSQKKVKFKNPSIKDVGQWRINSPLQFIKGAVTEIDGHTDKTKLHNILDNLPLEDYRRFKDYLFKFFPNIKYEHHHRCEFCGHPETIKFDIESMLDLPPSYKSSVHEEIFNLAYHSQGGFSQTELYNLPVYLKRFYAKKLVEQKEKEKKEHDEAVKGSKSSKSQPMPKMPKSYSKPK